MFQLAFGLSPFQSGMLTFASAAGALAMKFLAQPILRVAGFRMVLVATALGGALFTALNALFTPATPHLLIITVLVAAGFLRSLFFTSTNALVFADIDGKDAAQATAIAAVTQQISIALGVAAAGGILEATVRFSGEPLELTAFSTAFTIVALVTASAAIPLFRLHPTAGNSVSGHRLEKDAIEQDVPPV